MPAGVTVEEVRRGNMGVAGLDWPTMVLLATAQIGCLAGGSRKAVSWGEKREFPLACEELTELGSDVDCAGLRTSNWSPEATRNATGGTSGLVTWGERWYGEGLRPNGDGDGARRRSCSARRSSSVWGPWRCTPRDRVVIECGMASSTRHASGTRFEERVALRSLGAEGLGSMLGLRSSLTGLRCQVRRGVSCCVRVQFDGDRSEMGRKRLRYSAGVPCRPARGGGHRCGCKATTRMISMAWARWLPLSASYVDHL
jgi:hypothetical protein